MRGVRPDCRPWPTAAMVLYGLGAIAALGVSVTLDSGGLARWTLIALPVALFAAASLVVRRAERRSDP